MADTQEVNVSERSTKADLLAAVQKLTSRAQSAERKLERAERQKAKDQADRVQAITDRIRAAKPKTQTEQLHNVITSATATELKEFAEFFDDFKDMHAHLPLALQRLIVGIDVLLGRDDEDEAVADAA